MFVHTKEDLFDGMINSIYIKIQKKILFNNVIILNKIQIRFADSNDLLLFENIYFKKWWTFLWIPEIYAAHWIYFMALLSSRKFNKSNLFKYEFCIENIGCLISIHRNYFLKILVRFKTYISKYNYLPITWQKICISSLKRILKQLRIKISTLRVFKPSWILLAVKNQYNTSFITN